MEISGISHSGIVVGTNAHYDFQLLSDPSNGKRDGIAYPVAFTLPPRFNPINTFLNILKMTVGNINAVLQTLKGANINQIINT